MAYLKNITGDELGKFIDFIPESVMDETLDDSDFDFFGIIEKADPIGVAVCDPGYEADITLKFIYIAPLMRGRGIMNRCLDQLKVYYWSMGYQHLYIRYNPFLSPQLDSYCRTDKFDISKGSSAYFEFRIRDVQDSELLSKKTKNVISLEQLGQPGRKEFYKAIRRDGIELVDFADSRDFILEHSVVYMENGKPRGLILLKKQGDDVEVALFYMKSHRPTEIYHMLLAVTDNLRRNYPQDTKIIFFCRNSYLVNVLEKLLSIEGNRDVTADCDLNNLDEYLA